MLDLIELWKGAEQVILIDAVLSGASPGTIHVWNDHIELKKLKHDTFRSSTHALGLADTIELAQVLDRLPKALIIYGIESTQFAAGTVPSREVDERIQRAAREIAASCA
jgi:hydrogenase maturation protease